MRVAARAATAIVFFLDDTTTMAVETGRVFNCGSGRLQWGFLVRIIRFLWVFLTKVIGKRSSFIDDSAVS